MGCSVLFLILQIDGMPTIDFSLLFNHFYADMCSKNWNLYRKRRAEKLKEVIDDWRVGAGRLCLLEYLETASLGAKPL